MSQRDLKDHDLDSDCAGDRGRSRDYMRTRSELQRGLCTVALVAPICACLQFRNDRASHSNRIDEAVSSLSFGEQVYGS